MDEHLKKRYWVLTWDDYYPSGGFGDVTFTTDSREEALAHKPKYHRDYKEVWDMTEREEIFE